MLPFRHHKPALYPNYIESVLQPDSQNKAKAIFLTDTLGYVVTYHYLCNNFPAYESLNYLNEHCPLLQVIF